MLTPPGDAELWAERARRAYAAMQTPFFRRRSGLYRRDGLLGGIGAAAHLWPAARAFVATLDLAGMPVSLRQGWDAAAAADRDLAMLERYWTCRYGLGAYASDVHHTPWSGDRYVDDNAWVGLGLVLLERLHPGRSMLDRTRQLRRFASSQLDQRRGGLYWVEQGHGAGRRNHDRNTVSTAPNAELALQLTELAPEPPDRAGAGTDEPDPADLVDWVHRTLEAPDRLFYDKIRGDGSIDRAVWSYNQGSMAGAHVLLARRDGAGSAAEHLASAEAIARATLARFQDEGFMREPPAFAAICFRNLLLVADAIADAALGAAILSAIRRWADAAWESARDGRDRFHFRDGVTLLGQSAVVSAHALLAWNPRDLSRLA